MLDRLEEIRAFRQFWFVTITPYGKEIEPNVPEKQQVMDSFRRLSGQVGVNSIGWRYDPIFLTEKYDLDFHIRSFERMAAYLSSYTDQCVISFLDLYQKTRRNFPEGRAVTKEEQEQIGQAFAAIGDRYGIRIRSCCEGTYLAQFGIDVGGCMTREILERAIGITLDVPKSMKTQREGCSCLMGNDIGMYHTCSHGCRYCYANHDQKTVRENVHLHDPLSPFLIGGFREGDQIHEARQESYLDGQLRLF
jgi:hypothetical protein